MADYLKMDISALEREIESLIVAYPELAEDDALKADMISGEFDVESVMSRVLSHLFEAQEMLDGMKPRFEDLSERKARWTRRQEAMKGLAQRVLTMSGRKSIALPEATVSATKGRDSVEVLDVNSLPQGYYASERKADKAAIKAAIESGTDIPGAQIKTGEPGIMVKTK